MTHCRIQPCSGAGLRPILHLATCRAEPRGQPSLSHTSCCHSGLQCDILCRTSRASGWENHRPYSLLLAVRFVAPPRSASYLVHHAGRQDPKLQSSPALHTLMTFVRLSCTYLACAPPVHGLTRMNGQLVNISASMPARLAALRAPMHAPLPGSYAAPSYAVHR